MKKFYETHKCEFDKATHTYTLVDTESGERKQLISVTQLLKKYGLAPDYSNVPESILERKAARGTLIHAEVENYIKREQIGLSSEIIDFINIVNKIGFEPTDSEFIVYNDSFAGTIDVGGLFVDGYGLIDIKTTSTLHRSAVQWQLSLYAYLCGCMGMVINHLGGMLLGSDSRYVEIEPIAPDQFDAFLKAVSEGGEFKPKELTVSSDTLAAIVNLNEFIANLKRQKDEAEEQLQSLKDTLTEQMRNNAVKSFENDQIKITYTEPTIRETLDTRALKADNPEIYAAYVRQSQVKDSVRITIR